MAMPPLQSEEYSQWNVCDDCLLLLADILKERHRIWSYPTHDEAEDDQRPQQTFSRLEPDLGRCNFQKGILTIKAFAPAVANEVQSEIDKLSEALNPVNSILDYDNLAILIGNAELCLRNVVDVIRPIIESHTHRNLQQNEGAGDKTQDAESGEKLTRDAVYKTIEYKTLTEAERKVFNLILEKGPLIGKKICNATGIDQSVLTKSIIPTLKDRFGVQNRPTVGYFVDLENSRKDTAKTPQ